MITSNCELIDFVNLDDDEKRMILSWRNEDRVKKWMYTNSDIQLEDHFSFIETLKGNVKKKYFLVKDNGKDIGVVNFTNISKHTLDMGLYSNPYIKGVGRLLIEVILNYSFNILNVKKVYAEVFRENQKAFNLYKEFGFKKYKEKKVNNRDVDCLEFVKNENR